MKPVMILFIALFATTAVAEQFSENVFGTYQTQGSWKDHDGGDGAWSSSLTLSRGERDESGAEVVLYKEAIAVRHGDETYELEETFTFQLKSGGFFDILFDGSVIGEGYCYERHCHLAYGLEDTKIEESFLFTARGARVVRHGSQVRESYRIAWRGVGRKSSKN